MGNLIVVMVWFLGERSSGITIENNWDENKINISYKPPSTIKIKLDRNMLLEICFAYSHPLFASPTGAKISQRAYFKLNSAKKEKLSTFQSIASKITNLISFSINDIASIKNVSVQTSEITIDINEKQTKKEIAVYYRSTFFSDKPVKKQRHEMILCLQTIQNHIENSFKNWIDSCEKLSPAINLYLSTKSGAQRFIDGQFLSLIQALESYHRRTSNETLMDNQSYILLITEIIKGCPEEHKDWLQGRLMHGNEISLAKRLRKITEPFKKHLGSTKNINSIIRKITDTRNYLTHYTEHLHEKSAKGTEMWVLCQIMEALFYLHFLKIIGLTDEEIDTIATKNYLIQRKLALIK